jgi:poly(3-hydroxyalkanoate) synthetase
MISERDNSIAKLRPDIGRLSLKDKLIFPVDLEPKIIMPFSVAFFFMQILHTLFVSSIRRIVNGIKVLLEDCESSKGRTSVIRVKRVAW